MDSETENLKLLYLRSSNAKGTSRYHKTKKALRLWRAVTEYLKNRIYKTCCLKKRDLKGIKKRLNGRQESKAKPNKSQETKV